MEQAEDYRAKGCNMGRFSYCADYLLVPQTALRIFAQSSLFLYRETLLGGIQGDPRWAPKRGLARIALYIVANQRIEFFCVLTPPRLRYRPQTKTPRSPAGRLERKTRLELYLVKYR